MKDRINDPDNYWFKHSNAVAVADRRARRTGIRQRVQRVTWGSGRLRWYISPTPAAAPRDRVSEPCS